MSSVPVSSEVDFGSEAHSEIVVLTLMAHSSLEKLRNKTKQNKNRSAWALPLKI